MTPKINIYHLFDARVPLEDITKLNILAGNDYNQLERFVSLYVIDRCLCRTGEIDTYLSVCEEEVAKNYCNFFNNKSGVDLCNKHGYRGARKRR
jgi:hypothetical protein